MIPGVALPDGWRLRPAGAADAGVLAGLDAAHRLKMVHRDLKPANLFLAKQPDRRSIVKILDFGIARRIATDLATVEMKTIAPEEQLTRDFGETIKGEIIGTVVYMSPEQTRGEMLDAGMFANFPGFLMADTDRKSVV